MTTSRKPRKKAPAKKKAKANGKIPRDGATMGKNLTRSQVMEFRAVDAELLNSELQLGTVQDKWRELVRKYPDVAALFQEMQGRMAERDDAYKAYEKTLNRLGDLHSVDLWKSGINNDSGQISKADEMKHRKKRPQA